ncbi:MAG: hypothetical protein CM15mP115_09650 [Alphaproteobacteria bacterium]|nr:MAG: hypothetical protein CM15mP115_09650 [Alphaproteobacteria bacterium]
MTYIVNDNCINCKYTDCVEVCPVDCFYEGENMLVIHPDECIDCGVCEPECPPEAILPDSEPAAEKWLEINREMAEIWPNIVQRSDPDAERGNRPRKRPASSRSISRAIRARATDATFRLIRQPDRSPGGACGRP